MILSLRLNLSRKSLIISWFRLSFFLLTKLILDLTISICQAQSEPQSLSDFVATPENDVILGLQTYCVNGTLDMCILQRELNLQKQGGTTIQLEDSAGDSESDSDSEANGAKPIDVDFVSVSRYLFPIPARESLRLDLNISDRSIFFQNTEETIPNFIRKEYYAELTLDSDEQPAQPLLKREEYRQQMNKCCELLKQWGSLAEQEMVERMIQPTYSYQDDDDDISDSDSESDKMNEFLNPIINHNSNDVGFNLKYFFEPFMVQTALLQQIESAYSFALTKLKRWGYGPEKFLTSQSDINDAVRKNHLELQKGYQHWYHFLSNWLGYDLDPSLWRIFGYEIHQSKDIGLSSHSTHSDEISDDSTGQSKTNLNFTTLPALSTLLQLHTKSSSSQSRRLSERVFDLDCFTIHPLWNFWRKSVVYVEQFGIPKLLPNVVTHDTLRQCLLGSITSHTTYLVTQATTFRIIKDPEHVTHYLSESLERMSYSVLYRLNTLFESIWWQPGMGMYKSLLESLWPVFQEFFSIHSFNSDSKQSILQWFGFQSWDEGDTGFMKTRFIEKMGDNQQSYLNRVIEEGAMIEQCGKQDWKQMGYGDQQFTGHQQWDSDHHQSKSQSITLFVGKPEVMSNFKYNHGFTESQDSDLDSESDKSQSSTTSQFWKTKIDPQKNTVTFLDILNQRMSGLSYMERMRIDTLFHSYLQEYTEQPQPFMLTHWTTLFDSTTGTEKYLKKSQTQSQSSQQDESQSYAVPYGLWDRHLLLESGPIRMSMSEEKSADVVIDYGLDAQYIYRKLLIDSELDSDDKVSTQKGTNVKKTDNVNSQSSRNYKNFQQAIAQQFVTSLNKYHFSDNDFNQIDQIYGHLSINRMIEKLMLSKDIKKKLIEKQTGKDNVNDFKSDSWLYLDAETGLKIVEVIENIKDDQTPQTAPSPPPSDLIDILSLPQEVAQLPWVLLILRKRLQIFENVFGTSWTRKELDGAVGKGKQNQQKQNQQQQNIKIHQVLHPSTKFLRFWAGFSGLGWEKTLELVFDRMTSLVVKDIWRSMGFGKANKNNDNEAEIQKMIKKLESFLQQGLNDKHSTNSQILDIRLDPKYSQLFALAPVDFPRIASTLIGMAHNLIWFSPFISHETQEKRREITSLIVTAVQGILKVGQMWMDIMNSDLFCVVKNQKSSSSGDSFNSLESESIGFHFVVTSQVFKRKIVERLLQKLQRKYHYGKKIKSNIITSKLKTQTLTLSLRRSPSFIYQNRWSSYPLPLAFNNLFQATKKIINNRLITTPGRMDGTSHLQRYGGCYACTDMLMERFGMFLPYTTTQNGFKEGLGEWIVEKIRQSGKQQLQQQTRSFKISQESNQAEAQSKTNSKQQLLQEVQVQLQYSIQFKSKDLSPKFSARVRQPHKGRKKTQENLRTKRRRSSSLSQTDDNILIDSNTNTNLESEIKQSDQRQSEQNFDSQNLTMNDLQITISEGSDQNQEYQQSKIHKSPKLKILAIGSHTGDCELMWIQKFHKDVQVIGVEPMQQAVDSYRGSGRLFDNNLNSKFSDSNTIIPLHVERALSGVCHDRKATFHVERYKSAMGKAIYEKTENDNDSDTDSESDDSDHDPDLVECNKYSKTQSYSQQPKDDSPKSYSIWEERLNEEKYLKNKTHESGDHIRQEQLRVISVDGYLGLRSKNSRSNTNQNSDDDDNNRVTITIKNLNQNFLQQIQQDHLNKLLQLLQIVLFPTSVSESESKDSLTTPNLLDNDPPILFTTHCQGCEWDTLRGAKNFMQQETCLVSLMPGFVIFMEQVAQASQDRAAKLVELIKMMDGLGFSAMVVYENLNGYNQGGGRMRLDGHRYGRSDQKEQDSDLMKTTQKSVQVTSQSLLHPHQYSTIHEVIDRTRNTTYNQFQQLFQRNRRLMQQYLIENIGVEPGQQQTYDNAQDSESVSDSESQSNITLPETGLL